MKHILLIITLLALTALHSEAQQADDVAISHFSTERDGKHIQMDMDIDMSALDVDANRAVILTPIMTNGTDSICLHSVGIYGRRRYYYYVRNNESMLTGKDEETFRAGHQPSALSYEDLITYSPWMDGSSVKLHREDYGCCGTVLLEKDYLLGSHHEEFFPTLVYATPVGQSEKHDSIEGSAFVEFPVNKTVIHADYRNNVAELGKIQASIDSVRGDGDITITQVWLRGYASPESPYQHNDMLARGRTAALKDYIRQLYNFNEGIIETDYEAEDWAGLRRYVDRSNLDQHEEIIQLIDSTMDPDLKEQEIKKCYPQQYKFLLENCYPTLRHTDYRISYIVRTFTDVEEISRIMHTQPQKLSLSEFYLLSEQYEPGSDNFTEVFETAVRMYPADESANLNAANAALRRNDLVHAAKYLEKAGSSAEAIYARAAYAIRSADYERAETLLTEASSLGLEQAEKTLDELKKRE